MRHSTSKTNSITAQKKGVVSKKVNSEFQKRDPVFSKRKDPPAKGLLQLKKLKKSCQNGSDTEMSDDSAGDSEYEPTIACSESSECEISPESESEFCRGNIQTENTEEADGSNSWFSVRPEVCLH